MSNNAGKEKAAVSANVIKAADARTLPGLFRLRAEQTPSSPAYLQYDKNTWTTATWQGMYEQAGRWQRALANLGLRAGERVAILHRNSREWVLFEQAALALGLVVVPLYTWDNPGNIAFILGDSDAGALLVGKLEQWRNIKSARAMFPHLRHVLCLEQPGPDRAPEEGVVNIYDLLAEDSASPEPVELDAGAPATIIYTSGTTGSPKGVILSHHNILWNAEAVLQTIPAYPEDLFLSFLPLSHALERTVGYYVPMMAGSSVAYARSVQELGSDLQVLRPTILIAVPRIFERIHGKVKERMSHKKGVASQLMTLTLKYGRLHFQALQEGKKGLPLAQRLAHAFFKRMVANSILAKLGGRLRLAVSGGAPLPEEVADFFLSLGLPLVQGYGLSEAAPVVSANTLEDNVFTSVGRPLPGVEVRLGSNDELLVRSSAVMRGYHSRPRDTAEAIDADGWLRTGDTAMLQDGRIYIKGRIKDILVTSTGEKIAPADLEAAIMGDPLIDRAMVIGEGKPYLAALLALEPGAWKLFAQKFSLNPADPVSLSDPLIISEVLSRVRARTQSFPSYAAIRAVVLTPSAWTIENNLLTPTLKVKRRMVEKRFAREIMELYRGH